MGIIIEDISGKTKVYGILGWPVGHSFSPVLQNTLADTLGVDMRYVPFPVEPKDLKAAVNGGFAMGIQGFNVTVPHKQSVIDCLCGIDPLAAQIGAVNTLKWTEDGYFGFNTDIFGLERAFALQGVSLNQKHVVVLGAGGAAHAAVILAAARGAKTLTIVNRTIEKGAALAERVKGYYDVPVAVMDYPSFYAYKTPEIIIQTTSVGMGKPEESPVRDLSVFDRAEVALDIIYTPWETKFLQDAAARGVKPIGGFDMLIYQGVASFELWQGEAVSPDVAMALRNQLAAYYKRGQDK